MDVEGFSQKPLKHQGFRALPDGIHPSGSAVKLGTEYTLSGNQIKQYQTMREEIDKLIEKKRASIMLEAYEEEYKAAVESNKQLESEFAKAYATYSEQNAKVQSEYADMMSKTDEELFEAAVTRNDQRAANYLKEKETLRQSKENYKDYAEQIALNHQTMTLYEDAYVAAQEGNTAEVIELLQSQQAASSLTADKEFESTEERKKYYEDMYKSFKSAQDTYAKELKKGTEGYTEEGLAILKEYTDECKSQMEKAGKNTNQGYADGINNSMGLISGAAQRIADAVKNVVGKSLQIKSPSRVMKKLGQYTGEGFEIGLDESMKDAVSTLQRDLDAGAAVLSNVQPFSVPMGFGNPAFSSSAGRSVTYGDFSVVVNAAPGMDENALADVVAYKLQTQVMQKEAAFR